MKLQGMGIVFVLIAIPLILVLSYYIQLQVDTISIQTKYDNFLLGATYDAMSSFEINTANEDLSTVSDSLRTIIEASSNVFINTLATNLGYSNASKSYIEPYIPALLYTLYDGYYISSPTKVPKVLTNSEGNAVSVGDAGVSTDENGVYAYKEQKESYIKYSDLVNGSDIDKSDDYGQLLYLKSGETNKYTANINEAEFTTKNVLKTYMPYSARYVTGIEGRSNYRDVVITYSLDNFITVEGNIGDDYYTQSGYLIPDNAVKIEKCGDYEDDAILSYNQEFAQEVIRNNECEITVGGETIISSGGYTDKTQSLNEKNVILKEAQELRINQNKGVAIKLDKVSEDLKNKLNPDLSNLQYVIDNLNNEIADLQYELDKISAVEYYVKAEIFSSWTRFFLSVLEENDLKEISGQKYTLINGHEDSKYDFSKSTKPLFQDITSSKTNGVIEIDENSVFYRHKMEVIKQSIQYNLNLAMSTYSNISASTIDYSMPVILSEQWEQILSNPTIVSFMQGYKCGLKTYNNYKIVSSTNNEIYVSPSNIYFVEKEKFSNEISEYHRIDCPKFEHNLYEQEYISFTSKEVKYDKIYNKNNSIMEYTYDHKNLACYTCINDGNYESEILLSEPIFKDYGNSRRTDYYKALEKYEKSKNIRKPYFIGVGKEKNNLYKMNAIEKPQGYKIIDNSNKGEKLYNTVKAFEIVYGNVISDKSILNLELVYNGITISNKNSIITNSPYSNTVVINLDLKEYREEIGELQIQPINIKFKTDNGEDDDSFKSAIKYFRVIYN